MHALLAPVFAQLLTLGLVDRVEADYIASGQPNPGTDQQSYFESKNTTTPSATLKLDWRRSTLTFGYAPTLTIVPLEEKPREFLLYHQGVVQGEYRFRRTTLRIGQTAGYGERDFYKETLTPGQVPPTGAANPQQTPTQTGQPPATGTTTPGGPTQPGSGMTGAGTPSTGTGGAPTGGAPTTGTSVVPALSTRTRYGAFRTSGSVDQVVTRAVSWRLTAGYWVAGGMDTEARKTYPLVRGPDASGNVRYSLDARNTLTTIVTSQLAYSDDGSRAFLVVGNEDYVHQFTRRTMLLAGAGLSFGRSEAPLRDQNGNPYANRLPLYSVYPTGRLAMAHSQRVGRGTLMLAVGAATSPVVDITTASLDPRIGSYLTAAWNLKRLTVTASGVAAVSIAKNSSTSLDSLTANLVAHYELKSGFMFDGGVRTVWQRYGTETLIQPSAIFFVAVSWAGLFRVNEPRPP